MGRAIRRCLSPIFVPKILRRTPNKETTGRGGGGGGGGEREHYIRIALSTLHFHDRFFASE